MDENNQVPEPTEQKPVPPIMEQKTVKFEIGKVLAVVIAVVVIAGVASVFLSSSYFKGASICNPDYENCGLDESTDTKVTTTDITLDSTKLDTKVTTTDITLDSTKLDTTATKTRIESDITLDSTKLDSTATKTK